MHDEEIVKTDTNHLSEEAQKSRNKNSKRLLAHTHFLIVL